FAWVFDSNTCRSLPDTLYYSLVPAPEFEFAADSILICPRDKTELDAGTGYAGYAWSTGDSTQSILTGRAGSYFATVTDGTCYTVDTVTVYIVPLYVSLPPDTYLCDDETMDLNVENENAVYEWSTGETSPHITIYPGVRWIRVTVHKENCVLSDSIYIDRCPDWPEHVIELPNAFSPNGDGYNDQLKVLGYYITNLDLMIFNRFGKLLYRTSDPDEAMSRGWDGTYEGKLQETDVYVYHLSATFTDGSAVFKKGNITLLK
ncbi:MAG: gliding motility-associated C-terminal domain-containing protein, partial [Bacteroidetes bacterium]|nr:gliding motility-associated C-terminal domain-containing protein [Bacteroidota bacterium]